MASDARRHSFAELSLKYINPELNQLEVLVKVLGIPNSFLLPHALLLGAI